jgi:hypothetical protein
MKEKSKQHLVARLREELSDDKVTFVYLHGHEMTPGRDIRLTLDPDLIEPNNHNRAEWINAEGRRVKWISAEDQHVAWLNSQTATVSWDRAVNDHVHTPAGRDIGIGEGPKTIVPTTVSFEKEKIGAKNSPQLPPAIGEALVVLFCSRNRVDAVMGDLEERFNEEVAAKGERRARLLYWARVLRSIGPLLLVKIRHAGILAAIFEIGRRWSGLS